MQEPASARILIVDDEESLVKALSNTLQERGYQTAGFTQGRAALDALRQTQFDLLLSDIMMPGMDGITLLRGALELDPHLVAIMMTGEGTITTAVEAMKSGAFDYILKPFKLSFILPVLSRAMSLRRLRHENIALQQRIHQRTLQLEAANKELEAFSYSVSHDLRAPLRHIAGYVHYLTLSDNPTRPEDDRKNLARIASCAERMARLIDDLLEFSRMGRLEMRQSSLNPNALLEEVIGQLQPETQSRNIIWKKNPLPEIHADPALFRQVLSNLVSNAVKYSRPRNPAEIEIGCLEETPREIVLFVRDNGVGFDMKHADKLFGVFQRLHRQEDFEGTGIGLANVRRIIARHGGRTWAEGKVDGGATFYLSLPKGGASPTERRPGRTLERIKNDVAKMKLLPLLLRRLSITRKYFRRVCILYVQCKLVLLKSRVLIGRMQKASAVESNEQWAAREFSGAVFPDQRLVKRLIKIASHFAQTPRGVCPKPAAPGRTPKGLIDSSITRGCRSKRSSSRIKSKRAGARRRPRRFWWCRTPRV